MWVGRDDEFSLGYAEFDFPIGHPNGHEQWSEGGDIWWSFLCTQ